MSETVKDNMSLLDTRKCVYECLLSDLELAKTNKESVFYFNCPVFEEIAEYVFKFTGYNIEEKSVEDAERYLLNLKETINRLEFNESVSSAFEELGIN